MRHVLNRFLQCHPRKPILSAAQLEALEPRQMLSAQPVADFTLDHRIEHQTASTLLPATTDAHAITGLDAARADYGFTGLGQTVAVIDSGIAYDHYALGGGLGTSFRVVGGWDFTEENDGDPYDDGPLGAHGTHVAGIIGSTDATNWGVAPGVDLVALRVFNDQGLGYFSWVEQALQWVIDHRNDFENPITAINLSIGTTWNSASIPGWTTLEDEFAQLEAAGVFIAVAAGNGFASYGTAGLSYPAASSHVVPVASVDGNGQLSGFSQRLERVIAAPGRSIRSTVPDYVGNFNGATDDFAAFSGTSMASPYVAGASVLVRQAMEFAGAPSITQNAIYDVMWDTADLVYDAATRASYHRLNLQRALESIMPADDFGSTAATAQQLGTLGTSTTLAGLIGRLDDADYFTFTAAQSGTATWTADGDVPLVWASTGGGTASGNVLTMQVVAGQTYTVGLAAGGQLGRYTLDGKLVPAVVDKVVEISGQNVILHGTDGDDRFSFTAGATHQVVVNGVAYQFDAATYNSFRFVGGKGADTMMLVGTSGAEIATLRAGSVELIGADYSAMAGDVESIVVYGGGGSDHAVLHGTAGNDSFAASGQKARMTGAGYDNTAYGFAQVDGYSGGGIDDRAYLHDTAGVDTFSADSLRAEMRGTLYANAAHGFGQVYAYSRGDGDRAFFYDSPGNDVFTAATSAAAAMRGAGYKNTAYGFAESQGFASGGNDRAFFYGGSGADSYAANSVLAQMSGAGFWNKAYGFDLTYGYGRGGADRAYLHDSAGSDTFVATALKAELRGAGFRNLVFDFPQVYAYSQGGGDRAYFYDTSAGDVFAANNQLARMRGSGYANTAYAFAELYAYSTGGTDRAFLYGTAANDTLVSAAGFQQLSGPGYRLRAEGFAQTTVFGRGGVDRATLVEVAGDAVLYGRNGLAQLQSPTRRLELQEFSRITAQAAAGTLPRADVAATDYVYETLGTWRS